MQVDSACRFIGCNIKCLKLVRGVHFQTACVKFMPVCGMNFHQCRLVLWNEQQPYIASSLLC